MEGLSRKMTKWINSILKKNCSNWKWVRKRLGGYWELWYIDIIHTEIWFQIKEEQAFGNYRPGCGYGTPFCEYYDLGFFDYKTQFDLTQCKREKLLNDLYK